MMRRGLAVLSLMMVAMMGGSVRAAEPLRDSWSHDDSDYAERDEINQTYTLPAGATVEINDISGPVSVETSDGNTAEVRVVSSARSREELARRKAVVEQSGSTLRIYTPQDRERRWH